MVPNPLIPAATEPPPPPLPAPLFFFFFLVDLADKHVVINDVEISAAVDDDDDDIGLVTAAENKNALAVDVNKR